MNEVIRPESHYQHARDLDQVNALPSILALRSAQRIAISGANQRLPHRMFKIAEAKTRLNTHISRITLSGERR